MAKPFYGSLYLVASQEACGSRDILWVVEQAVKGGVDLVQLREKHLDTEQFIKVAVPLKEVLDKYGVPLIINDNIEAARKSNAYGMHVGNNDISPAEIKRAWPECGMVGYSIEYIEQLDNEQIQYTDYLGISPVFNTPTKTDTVTEWGLEGIRLIRSLTYKPLVAIGNINSTNAYDVIKAGADSLAVVSAICAAINPAKAAEAIRNQIEKAL